MNLTEFIDKVIEHGIAAAKADYTRPDQADKLRGSLDGFEACRGKDPVQLAKLLGEAAKATAVAHMERAENYWEIRCKEMEIEWVCNEVSAILVQNNLPPIVTPTVRGAMAAYRIVASEGCIVVQDETPAPITSDVAVSTATVG